MKIVFACITLVILISIFMLFCLVASAPDDDISDDDQMRAIEEWKVKQAAKKSAKNATT